MTPLLQAHMAYKRLAKHIPPETRRFIEQRLHEWQRLDQRHQEAVVVKPALVLRPGLSPRPLNKHYFTVVQSYDEP